MAALENMGVTVAVQVSTVGRELEAARKALADVAEYAMSVRLPEHVGGARPRSDFAVTINGPEEDPLQGWIYGVSVWAAFDPDDLPATCPAAVARRNPERRGPAASERR